MARRGGFTVKVNGCLRLLLISWLSTLAVTSHAEPPLQFVRGYGDWPPLEMVRDGELVGVHIDLIKAVALRLNWQVEYLSVPWLRAIHMMKSGKADAIIYFAKNSEREAFTIYHDGSVLSYERIGFFTSRVLAKSIDYRGELMSLQPYVIGAIRGYDYGERLKQADYLTKIDSATTEQQLLEQFMAGRFTVGLGELGSIQYWAEKMGVDQQLVFLRPYVFERRPVYLAFSRSRVSQERVDEFANAMETYKTTPAFTEILRHYDINALEAQQWIYGVKECSRQECIGQAQIKETLESGVR